MNRQDADDRARRTFKKKGFKDNNDYWLTGLKNSPEVSHLGRKGLFGRLSGTTLCGQSTQGFAKRKYLYIGEVGCSDCRHILASETPNQRDVHKLQDAFAAGLSEEEVWKL